METVSIHTKTENIGDVASAPSLYFPFLRGKSYDSMNPMADMELEGKMIVVGGGGFLDGDGYSCKVKALAGQGTKVVAWGIGTNSVRVTYPDYSPLKDYHLVGCRDWGSPFELVPCASCMSPVFDECLGISPTYEAVLYYHHQTTNMRMFEVPMMKNNCHSIREAITFMSMGEVVLTNTYHGMYWATLLGKKVVVVSPWSSKFYHFPYRHLMTSWREMFSGAKRAKCYPEALEECRDANRRFAVKVEDLMI